MRVWLCLLSLGITSCSCDSELSYVDAVVDLRTKYRQFLPEQLTDIPDPLDEESQELNLTGIHDKYKKAGYNCDNWSQKDSRDDPNISEQKREWMKRMNPRVKNEYSWEYNSSEYRKYQKSLERRMWVEGNTTDVFEEDLSDLWDLYMANRTLPPNFPLAYSPPFMFQKYREYSLSYYNITVPTTKHWLLGPLTGDDGVQYDIAVERYRKYNISKTNPEKVAAANRFLENDMKGKKLNKTKDIVRYFIDLRRRLGVTLNWTQPTISISHELKNMNVPDTQEILNKLEKEQPISKEIEPPDIEAYLRNYNSKEILVSGERKTTESESTTENVGQEKRETTEMETPTPETIFVYQFNPISRAAFRAATDDREDFGPTTAVSSKLEASVKTEKPASSTEKSEKVTTEKILSKAPESTCSTSHKPIQSDVPKPEKTQQQPKSAHRSSSDRYHSSTTKSKLGTPLEFEDKYRNHTAVKFLHKHKNKFLLGGMVCLIAAKVFGS